MKRVPVVTITSFSTKNVLKTQTSVHELDTSSGDWHTSLNPMMPNASSLANIILSHLAATTFQKKRQDFWAVHVHGKQWLTSQNRGEYKNIAVKSLWALMSCADLLNWLVRPCCLIVAVLTWIIVRLLGKHNKFWIMKRFNKFTVYLVQYLT